MPFPNLYLSPPRLPPLITSLLKLTKGVVVGGWGVETKGSLFWAPCSLCPWRQLQPHPVCVILPPAPRPLSIHLIRPCLLFFILCLGDASSLLQTPLYLLLWPHTPLAWVRGGVLSVTQIITAGMFPHGSILPSGGEEEGNKTYVLKRFHPPTYSLHINA